MCEAGQAVLESSSDGGLNPWGGRGMINPGGCQLRKGSINTTGHLEAQLCVAEAGEETHISVDGVCTPGCAFTKREKNKTESLPSSSYTQKCYMEQRSCIKTQKLYEKISTLKKSSIGTTLEAQG